MEETAGSVRARATASWPKVFFAASVLAAVYYAAAKYGLSLASVHPSATAIWPPTGIALAAVLLLGPRVAPGVFLGAFLANVTTAGTVATSLAIAGGNTLEAVLGAWLVRRFAGGPRSFERARDVFAFAALAGFAASAVSATVGVTSLALAGFAGWGSYLTVWSTWWIGDAAGAIVVAPLILLWAQPPWPRPATVVALEAVVVGGACGVVSILVFSDMVPFLAQATPRAFIPLPLIVWGAYRFGPRAAATIAAIISAVAIASTVRGEGPFAAPDPGALVFLQVFTITITLTGLTLGAVVAESRRGSEELQRQTRRFQAIIDQSPASIAAFAPDGRLTTVNQAALDLHVIAPDPAAPEPAAYNLFEDGALADAGVLSHLERAFDGEIVRVPPFLYDPAKRGAPGPARWLEVFAYPVKDARGAVREVVVVQEDLTERKRAEEDLRVQREYLRTVIDTDPHFVFAKDWEGRFTLANKAVAAVYGTTPEELVGRTDADFNPVATEVAAYIAADREVMATGRMKVIPEEPVTNARTGETRWFETIKVRLDGPGGPEVLGVSTDVTARKRAQDDLRLAHDRLRVIFEEAGVGILFSDLRGGAIEVNATLADMLGYTREELLAFGADIVRRVTHPDDFEADLSLFTSLMAGARDRYAIEKRYLRKDGSVVWGSLSVSLVRDAGEPRYVIATVQDVTERRTAEEEVRKYRARLEELVTERTEALAAANRDLEAFTARVSHDLRAPLRAVEVLTGALIEDHAKTLDPTARALLERVVGETARMARLVDDLLRLARATRDGLRRERVDLTALVRDVVAGLLAREPSRRVDVVVQEGLSAVGDGPLLRVVLENLLGNAWKFTSKRADARVVFGAAEVGGERAFFVRDNGVGFDPAKAGDLFRAFGRLHSDADFPGTGIGLTTVQTIVARHGGRVWAESEPGRGAVFWFTLPDPGHSSTATP